MVEVALLPPKVSVTRWTPRILLAILLTGILAYPWRAPQSSIQLSGFDRNYLYVDPVGNGKNPGIVTVTRNQLSVAAVAGSQPRVVLAGSPVAFSLDYDIVVLNDTRGPDIPFETVVYFPGIANRISLWYDSIERWIRGDVFRANFADRVGEKFLGKYTTGTSTHVRVDVVPSSVVTFTISNSTWTGSYSENTELLGPLLSAERRAVEIVANGNPSGEGISSSLVVTNFTISIPQNPLAGPRVSQGFLIPVFIATTVAILFVLRSELRTARTTLLAIRRYRFPRVIWPLALGALLLHIGVSSIASHPYDIFVEEVYTYTLIREGLGAIYSRPLVTAAASPWLGAPFGDATFVYPPFSGYYFLLPASIASIAGVNSISAPTFELVIKLVGSLATVLGGFVTYTLVQKIGGSNRRALLGAGLFLFNPALGYDTAVWGQTDSYIATMLLASALFLVTKRNTLFWTTALATVLAKQTALVPATFLIIVAVRSSSRGQLLKATTNALGIVFILLLPYLFLGYSPQIAVSHIGLTALGQVSGLLGASGNTLSRDAYSFLPLLGSLNGLTGRDRMFLSASATVPGTGISYSLIGIVLFVAGTVPIIIKELRRSSKDVSSQTLLAMGTVSLVSFLFLPGTSSRYFALGVSLLIPSGAALRSRITPLSITILTTTALLSMHGLLVFIAAQLPGILPALNPEPGVNALVLSLYLSDSVTTAAILANLLAVSALVIYLLRRPNDSHSLTRPETKGPAGAKDLRDTPSGSQTTLTAHDP